MLGTAKGSRRQTFAVRSLNGLKICEPDAVPEKWVTSEVKGLLRWRWWGRFQDLEYLSAMFTNGIRPPVYCWIVPCVFFDDL